MRCGAEEEGFPVGPTRMDYAKITARLSYLAEGLSRLFGQGELPQGRDDEK